MNFFCFEIKRIKKNKQDKGIRFMKKILVFCIFITTLYAGLDLYICWLTQTPVDPLKMQTFFEYYKAEAWCQAFIKVVELITDIKKKGSTE